MAQAGAGSGDRGPVELDDGVVPTYGHGMIPVVGLGGSAGSIEALQAFFRAMPPDSGLAFVVILHLSSDHESALAELLQRCTRMPVVQVCDSLIIHPNSVYVIPPGHALRCAAGSLSVSAVPRQAPHVLVDLFFRTLADSHGPHAAAVVLSGMDGDGAVGIRRIKERGGLTVAQDPAQAQHQGMPRSSIGTGMVDWILPVEAMPARLASYFRLEQRLQLPREQETAAATSSAAHDEQALADVLALLHSRTARDFGAYKRGTILRRLGRRMQVNGVDNLQDYLACLGTEPGESAALLQDLLISVTHFFRDPPAFEALATLIPTLFEGRRSGDTVRVWVPACATGEEAYSVAMLLAEQARTLASPPTLQVFASDIDEEGLRAARQGCYPLTIEADVSGERLDRFFLREHQAYRVRKELREMVLFATHDILQDPAFTRTDLVSCRNLLIYLNRAAQRQVLSTLHFSLAPGGKLFLGASDTAEDAHDLFRVLDKKYRIYATRRTPHAPILPSAKVQRSLSLPGLVAAGTLPPVGGREFDTGAGLPPAPRAHKRRWGDLHLELLEQIGPPSLLLNAEHEVVHLSPSAGRFMRPAGGEPTRNVFRCIHPELASGLHAALFQAGQMHEPVVLDPVALNIDGEDWQVTGQVNHTVVDGEGLFLVRLQTCPSEPPGPAAAEISRDQAKARHLEREIERLKLQLRETVEQYEAAAEEGKASNEELQAVNEELRSAAEEMETSREEEQSVVEELTTVNAELQNHILELNAANSDLHNLMRATEVATIFIDTQLRITRYTPAATSLFHLIPTDVGRPLTDLTSRVHYPELEADVRGVLETLVPKEREIGQAAGTWYIARLLPYRTLDDRIAGVVLTFSDITDRKQADEMRLWLSSIVTSAADAIISFDLSLIVLSWNRGAERLFGLSAAEAVGAPLRILEIDALHGDGLLERTRRGEAVENLSVTAKRKDGKLVKLAITVSPMRDQQGGVSAATVIARDITAAEQFAEEMRQQDAEYRLIVENVHEFALFATDLSGKVVRWSVAAQRLFGYAAAQIVGQSADAVFSAVDRAAGILEREVQAALVNGAVTQERMYQRQDGSCFWALGSLYVRRNRSGEAVGFVKLIRDRAEAHENSRLIERLSRELEMARGAIGSSGGGVPAER